MRRALPFLSIFALASSAFATDGDLDPTFGTGGKVQLPQAGGYEGTWMPTGVAEQSTGKIVIAGWNSQYSGDCFILRLNTDGSVDTAFGGDNGFPAGYAGAGYCKYNGVAVRPDNRIVVVGENFFGSPTRGLVTQFTADGHLDYSFASGSSLVEFHPGSGDTAVTLSRVQLDAGGNAIAAGTYVYANGNSDFYLARVSTDGSSTAHATYSFPATAAYHDTAHDLAITGDGSYYLAGTATSASGDLDCAIAHFYFDGSILQPDATFTGTPDTAGIAIGLNYGGDNNDYCLALGLQPPYDDLVLGGQATAVYGITWQTAVVITQPPDGLPNQRTDHIFWYDQPAGPKANDTDTVNRVLIQPYDNKVVLVGSGPNHTSSPAAGNDFGVLRLSGPSTPDTSFGANGFALYDIGSDVNPNPNHASSAVLSRNGIVIVGDAQDSTAGTDIAVIRLAPFDGIFKNGFEPVISIL